MKHQDNALNMLRVAALGLTAYYLYKVNRKEGSLGSVTSNPDAKFTINSDKIVDHIMPWVNLPPDQKQACQLALKSFAKAYLKEKGVLSET